MAKKLFAALCGFSSLCDKLLVMIAVNGIYENGLVKLDKQIRTKKNAKVIVTFLDEDIQNESKRLTSKDFSFLKSRDDSKRYKGCLSDVIIEDRKAEQ